VFVLHVSAAQYKEHKATLGTPREGHTLVQGTLDAHNQQSGTPLYKNTRCTQPTQRHTLVQGTLDAHNQQSDTPL
jgi:hypothetical protein